MQPRPFGTPSSIGLVEVFAVALFTIFGRSYVILAMLAFEDVDGIAMDGITEFLGETFPLINGFFDHEGIFVVVVFVLLIFLLPGVTILLVFVHAIIAEFFCSCWEGI